jgi:hypothetical protein
MVQAVRKTLATVADIKQHFAQNTVPYYFISASNFNLIDMHHWVRGWGNINLIDCYDGRHPQVLVVPDNYAKVFEDIEEINEYLINGVYTQAMLARNKGADGSPGKAIFLFFDENLERLCASLNMEIVLPKNTLVREIDSKIVTTEIGNQAGVMSVPNVLTKVTSWANLCEIAEQHKLGKSWVVQSAYGDSGKTTYFIANEKEYKKVAREIESEDMVKVMKRIRCAGTAIEACATRWGTFVGPLLTELIGIESLTPYAGGWCGNELYPTAFTPELRRQVMKNSQAMGDALYQRGYRGYFELDYLIDLDTDDVWLGELNARITGISAMTNMSDFSANNIPLFLFHLLEYDPAVDLTLDVNAFNEKMLAEGASGTAAQVILKYLEKKLQIITQAPVSGVYRMKDDGSLELKTPGYNRREALAPDEAFILRIMGLGEYAYKGGDLSIMFINQVIRTDDGKLNPVGTRWVDALQGTFKFRNLNQEERSLVERANNPATSKGSNRA